MSVKARTNAALARLTGYHLERGVPGAPSQDVKKPWQKPSRAKPKAAGNPAMPADFDAAAVKTIRRVRPYTMTHRDKIFGLILATRYVVRHKIPGDIVECGVWRGGSMQAVAYTLHEAGDTSRDLYLFDTFEGMTEPTEHDVRKDGVRAGDLMQTMDRSSNLWAVASLDDVKSGFEGNPYPEEKRHYIVGPVEETIPDALPETISILRLDTDWYESTRHELAHAYSRLSPGGVLILDDYLHWEGSRKAIDEFIADLDEPLLLHRLADGRIGVKPFPA
jgi:O-methyltransferase